MESKGCAAIGGGAGWRHNPVEVNKLRQWACDTTVWTLRLGNATGWAVGCVDAATAPWVSHPTCCPTGSWGDRWGAAEPSPGPMWPADHRASVYPRAGVRLVRVGQAVSFACVCNRDRCISV